MSIDDRLMTSERERRNPVRLVMPAVVARYHAVAPICRACSVTATLAGHPAQVPVERALIVRDTQCLNASIACYLAICFCHGAENIISFGETMPTENRIRSTVVTFPGKRTP